MSDFAFLNLCTLILFFGEQRGWCFEDWRARIIVNEKFREACCGGVRVLQNESAPKNIQPQDKKGPKNKNFGILFNFQSFRNSNFSPA